MASRQSVSSARERRARQNEKHMPDSRIDFSDVPESTDGELKRARRVGRPRTGRAKQLIAIRISPRLLADIRRRAARRSMPYQTLIHEILEKAAAGELNRRMARSPSVAGVRFRIPQSFALRQPRLFLIQSRSLCTPKRKS